MSSVDVAGPVRPSETFDVGKLDAWLKERLPQLSGSPRVTQFAGGASNWTYRLEYDGDDLVLRRPPEGKKAKSAHDMLREARIQQALAPVFPYVAEILATCDDTAVIGSEFYVMRRIEGVIPRARLPEGVTLEPDAARRLCFSVIDTLVALHRVDIARSGLEGLGKGTGYARRQIEGWSDRYVQARTWKAPRCRTVMAWLAAHVPEDVATCVIHNDFRLDNLVLDPDDLTRVVGVLDWEMATLGDPLMDLGNSLAYWVQPDDDFFLRLTRRQPTHLPGMLTRQELIVAYGERMGLPLGDFTFYEVYGLFRLAVIAQQIAYRYHHGQTKNPAFKRFWLLVHYLDGRCRRFIRASSRNGRLPSP
ncbi:MAG: phosphotransferase family protein [Thermoanaerobaculia bacterium]